MKQFRLFSTFAAAVVFSSLCLTLFCGAGVSAQEVHGGKSKHGLSVQQYEEFHDVLHPLEHEALPKGDFPRIRSQSALLVKRGKAMVKLGVPAGVIDTNKEQFATELNKFSEALAKFKTDAKKGTDDQLKVSYSAVHDSFEMLAGMLPRN